MFNGLPEAVLDASILIQTIVRERYTDIALKLVGRLKAIHVPTLTLYEVGNTLVILTHKSLITREDAMRKFTSVSSIPTLNKREVALGKAMEVAIELKVTLYDASYIVLSLEAEAPLITADRELYEKGRTIAKVIHASEVTL